MINSEHLNTRVEKNGILQTIIVRHIFITQRQKMVSWWLVRCSSYRFFVAYLVAPRSVLFAAEPQHSGVFNLNFNEDQSDENKERRAL